MGYVIDVPQPKIPKVHQPHFGPAESPIRHQPAQPFECIKIGPRRPSNSAETPSATGYPPSFGPAPAASLMAPVLGAGQDIPTGFVSPRLSLHSHLGVTRTERPRRPRPLGPRDPGRDPWTRAERRQARARPHRRRKPGPRDPAPRHPVPR